ncbi:MAG: cell envelope integrity protein TolA [Candidatus Electronema sp. VV]
MKGMNYDDWQAFLDERETGPGWQWPLNLAVAMHLAVFGSAVMLQNMSGSSPGLKLDNAVMVNFISLSASGPLSAAAPAIPVPAATEEPPLVELTAGKQRKISVRAAEPKAEVKPEKPLAKEAVPPPVAQEVKLEPKSVKKEAAAPVLVKPEPKVLEQVKPLTKTAVPSLEIKPAEPVKKTAAPEPKAAERPAPKPEAAPVQVKEAVSLNPVKPKEKVKEAAEEKAREQAKAAEMKRQAELAEAKKQEAVKAAKLEAEKKTAAAESKRVAEEKARKEKESAKIAEAKKKEHARLAEATKAATVEAEKKAAAAEARKKLAAQEQQKALAEARRIEHEADAARQAAVAAREQLVRALRENMAVSTAAAASRGGGSLLGTGRGSGLANATATVSTAGLNQYANQLREQISSRWKVPEMAAGNRKLKTVVALTVNKNGTIEDLQIEQKSGDPLFDQSVIKALRSAPLPKFFTLIPNKDRLEFAFNFTPQGLTL